MYTKANILEQMSLFKSLFKAAVDGASLMFLGNSFHSYAAAMLEDLSSNGN